MIPDQVGWMFPLIFALILLGIPVAFTLIFTGFLFGFLIFDFNVWLVAIQMHDRLLDVTSNFVLAAIPLFIMMGAILERSGLAQRLFSAIQIWLSPVPNGLALTTLVMCTLLAAASGVVGAVEVLVGLMAIPAMKKACYKDDLIAGTVCAGGSLGTIIPPSVLVVVYASAADISVGDMLAGVIIPGLLMVTGFGLYILVRGLFEKREKNPLPPEFVGLDLAQKIKLTLTAVVPTFLLILVVLGSILTGTATPTEAGALGVAGAMLLAFFSQGLTRRSLLQSLSQSVQVTGAITVIIFGGVAFTSIFVIGGGNTLILDAIAALDLSVTQTLLAFLMMIFVLGFFLDWVSVILISIPIFAPMVRMYGIDPVWFGVLVCIMLQTSYLTPPMAPSIFYLRSIAPSDMSYRSMYLGVLPFIVIQLLVLMVVLIYPWSATYLPSVLFRL